MDSIGVDVVSSSLGYSEFDATDFSYSYSDMNGHTTIVSQAVNLAFERGIVTITSAGNEGSSPWFYITSPADAFDVISVGAVTSNNNVDTYSSRGPTFDGRIKPEVVAMGTSVWGVIASQLSGYASNSGTSAAAPIVAGVAGLILSTYPHLSNIQVRSILMETSDNAASPDNERGYGLVSAVNAISYPNLQRITNSFILNKIFFNNTSIVPGSVKVNFIGKEGQSNSLPMGFDNLYKYNVEVPAYFDNELVQFYFSFTDSLGNTIREPSNTNYKFSYGDLEIALNLSLPAFAGDYIISDLYPNPYIPSDHNTVRFNYKSAGNEKLKLMIIDAAGQKVKSFETVTAEGENFMEWNGYSDNGYLCASGVYYFLVELNGQQFGRKLILLK
ncbi:MAG: S8 family serine peptidase [Ignavibacteriales bacterium]|nr:S8 family serine peptidase [Ignavibacteriales bacterium]